MHVDDPFDDLLRIYTAFYKRFDSLLEVPSLFKMNSLGFADKISWDSSRTKSLIIEYEKYPHLYNQHHELYRNKKTREETLGRIANALNVSWYGTDVTCTVEDIKKKLNGLRSQYLFERQKISRSAAQGEVYTPTIYWYPMLKFLEPMTSNCPPRNPIDLSHEDMRAFLTQKQSRITNSIEHITIDDNNSTSSRSETSTPETFIDVQGYLDRERTATQKILGESQDPLFIPCTSGQMMSLSGQVKRNKCLTTIEVADHLETFGKFVANELRGIYLSSDDIFLRQTKRRLQQVLIDAWSRIDMDESRYPASKKLKAYNA